MSLLSQFHDASFVTSTPNFTKRNCHIHHIAGNILPQAIFRGIQDTPAGIVTRTSTDLFAAESPVLRQALVWISNHLNVPFGVPQLAEALNVPRRTLDRLFATELATTVGRETLRQRLVQAKDLLGAKALSISVVYNIAPWNILDLAKALALPVSSCAYSSFIAPCRRADVSRTRP